MQDWKAKWERLPENQHLILLHQILPALPVVLFWYGYISLKGILNNHFTLTGLVYELPNILKHLIQKWNDYPNVMLRYNCCNGNRKLIHSLTSRINT